MFVDELLSDFRVRYGDVSNTFRSLVIDELEYVHQVVAVLVTLPEDLNIFQHQCWCESSFREDPLSKNFHRIWGKYLRSLTTKNGDYNVPES